ncbi:MAG: hypothetical protein QXX30_01265 [Candidatus Aenigmatarchaeota archaeon]
MNLDFYRPVNTVSLKKEDLKVSIIGWVERVEENFLILKDDFGKVKVNFSISDENIKKLNSNSLIRVFCTKIDDELYCDFFQILEGFDINLYKKIENLYFNLL